MINAKVTPVVDEFEDPYYPVQVSFDDVEGTIIYHHDRLYGRYLVDNDNAEFNEAIADLKNNRKSDWAKLTADIKSAVGAAMKSQ